MKKLFLIGLTAISSISCMEPTYRSSYPPVRNEPNYSGRYENYERRLNNSFRELNNTIETYRNRGHINHNEYNHYKRRLNQIEDKAYKWARKGQLTPSKQRQIETELANLERQLRREVNRRPVGPNSRPSRGRF